jgi:hypothetical protein
MMNHYACVALGTAVLMLAGSASAQDHPVSQLGEHDTPIAVIGCLQTELDYRRQHDTGQGGFFGTGAGMKNEFMLIGAMPAGSHAAAGIGPGTCGPNHDGETYELTGKHEKELAGLVGHWVVISGVLKKAEIDGTTGRPTGGGLDILRRDLELFEINVSEFREPPMPVAELAEAPVSRFEPAPAPPEPTPPALAQEPLPPAPAQEQPPVLPKTAGAAPTIAILGLLALASALRLRARRA